MIEIASKWKELNMLYLIGVRALDGGSLILKIREGDIFSPYIQRI